MTNPQDLDRLSAIRRKIDENREHELCDAVLTNDLDRLKTLHEGGVSFNNPLKRDDTYSHLISLAHFASDEVFAYILENTDKEVIQEASVTPHDSTIPLSHYLARYNKKEKIEMLLNTGYVDINKLSSQGITMLVEASGHNSWETASFLIDRGADVTTEVDGKPWYKILEENKENLIKNSIFYSYNEKDVGKTGNSVTGKVSEKDRDVADRHIKVAKAVMQANLAAKKGQSL